MANMGIPLRHLVLLWLVLLPALTVYAQVKSVRHAKGVVSIVNITPEDAKQKAIEAAKGEALRMAGAQLPKGCAKHSDQSPNVKAMRPFPRDFGSVAVFPGFGER